MDEKGYAKIKPDYILNHQDQDDDQEQLTTTTTDNSSSKTFDDQKEEVKKEGGKRRRKRSRGQDHQRANKMSKARAEMHQKSMRLCQSALFPESGKQCKFGEKCTAEHSREKYWSQKVPDLGPNCVNFDRIGKCPFSLSCRFARAHTNAEDLSQCEKEADPSWEATLNAKTIQLQQQLRKRQYDYSRADMALQKMTSHREAEEKGMIMGCMEREPPKLDMKSLRHKKYLAPLTTVGNLPFRRLCVELGADITCGEMAIATHILKGTPSELSLLKRYPSEKIFGVQLAGGFPDSLSKVVQIINENFETDFIDLNLEQRYTKAAEWDYVRECADAIDGKFPFFVSGDVFSYQDYYQHLSSQPIDGIMIGRGALVKPWIFKEIDERRDWDISSSERFDLIKKYVNYGLEHWGSDDTGVETTRRFLLEWLSFQHRYIPVGILQEPPQKINQRPPPYRGRDDLETLLASPASSDWVRISEMVLGKIPDGFVFIPKHKANAY